MQALGHYLHIAVIVLCAIYYVDINLRGNIMIVYVVVWILLSVGVGIYASKKGFSFITHFLGSILLSPLIGFLATAVSKPNLEKAEKVQMKNENLKKCDACAELIKQEAKICKHCQSPQ